MKYIKRFESIIASNLICHDREYIKSIENNITGILTPILDDGMYDINYNIADYEGHMSSISILRRGGYNTNNDLYFKDYLQIFETFYDYLKLKNFYIYRISIFNDVIYKDGKIINFTKYEWKDIQEILVDKVKNCKIPSLKNKIPNIKFEIVYEGLTRKKLAFKLKQA